MRNIIAAFTLSCALLTPTDAFAEGGGSASEALERSHAEVTSLVDTNAKAGDIQLVVDGLLDYSWIVTAALGGPKHYAERCAERCAEFEALLTELIRSNYLRHIEDNKKRGAIEYLDEHVRKTATKVDTEVTFSDKTGKAKVVAISYVMHEADDGHWQVRDIITEDVSLARNYKYELNKLYKDGGIDRVIDALRKKLDQLEVAG